MAYNWKADLARLESKYGIPAGLLGALVRAESGGNPNARSPVGAVGLTQLMPSTARGLGVDPNDPRQNLEGGAKYLSQQLRQFRDVNKALAAYNAGPGAVQKYGGVPPYAETKGYVKRINGYWRESSRFGQNTRSQAPQKRSPGIPVPQALPMPERKIQSGLGDSDVAALNHAFVDDPTMAQLIINNRVKKQNKFDDEYNRDFTAYRARQEQIQASQNANQTNILQSQQRAPGGYIGAMGKFTPYNPSSKFVKTPGGWVRNLNPNEQSYQFLQRIGRGFGLQNDPGDSQTTGGRHQDGSNHYAGRAIDWGNARNNPQQLTAFAQWARQNAQNIRELYYAPLGWSIQNGRVVRGNPAGGHEDHLHVAW